LCPRPSFLHPLLVYFYRPSLILFPFGVREIVGYPPSMANECGVQWRLVSRECLMNAATVNRRQAISTRRRAGPIEIAKEWLGEGKNVAYFIGEEGN